MVARYLRRSAGRPTEYRPEYCDAIVAAGRVGMSLTAFAGSIGKCRDTLLTWAKKYPSFAVAKQLAEAASAFYWEAKLRYLADTGKGNATAIIFALKNRVPEEWRDQITQKYEGSRDQPVVLTLDPEVLQRISTDQQETLRTVLRAIAAGGPAVELAASTKPASTPSRFAETLRADSATEGRA